MAEIKVKKVESCRVACLEAKGFDAMKESFGELGVWLKSSGTRRGDPPGIVIYVNSPKDVGWENCVTKVCVPVSGKPKPIAGRMKLEELPAITAACYVHKGPYDQLSVAWDKVYTWIFANGYEPTAVGREAYLNDCDLTQPEELLTEVQVPVAR